jgi:hypothetical protein
MIVINKQSLLRSFFECVNVFFLPPSPFTPPPYTSGIWGGNWGGGEEIGAGGHPVRMFRGYPVHRSHIDEEWPAWVRSWGGRGLQANPRHRSVLFVSIRFQLYQCLLCSGAAGSRARGSCYGCGATTHFASDLYCPMAASRRGANGTGRHRANYN